ncbi:MAG: hypothetical protein IKV81_00905 [Clostridia bacterium]|nr:hypothetical protein [Clostridia bacterium]
MNNIKYYNDSLAYDFEMFMPKQNKNAEQQNNIVVMPKAARKTKARRKAAARRLSPAVSVILATIVALSAVCANLAIRLKINEVKAEINDVKSAIAELDSEKTVLEVELERRISYANLEVEAMQLGMKKPDKDDVTYIKVNDSNACKIADGTLLKAE